MFFGSWEAIARIVVVGAAAYAALVALLRLAGSRSLAKLNAFDLVVTVALGSTLSSLILDSSIPLAEGVTTFAVLLGLQFAVSWASTRWKPVEAVTRAAPVVVFRDGRVLSEMLRAARLTEGEVRSVIRQANVGSMDHVEAVVLETSGELSVVVGAYTTRSPHEPSASALIRAEHDVRWPHGGTGEGADP